ncbi:MAG: hypothetical protein ACLU5I_08085 [Alistipes finegoldii]
MPITSSWRSARRPASARPRSRWRAAEGLQVGLLRPITLDPFPKKPLAELAARGVKGFLSAELNAGQMVEDVRLAVNGAAPVEHFGRQGGMMFAPDEVLAALKEKLIKK